MMFDMQLLHYRGIANLSYVVHAYVLVTYVIVINIMCYYVVNLKHNVI